MICWKDIQQFFRCFVWVLTISSTSLLCGNITLQKKDVREILEEILGFHVEHNQISPLLLQRAFKIYIEQFDAAKMYLLDSEVKQFLNINNAILEKNVLDYNKDDLSPFVSLNLMIQQAILRTQKWRKEIQKQLILHASPMAPSSGETYLAYATSENQLRDRVQKQQERIIFEEKRINHIEEWTPLIREKIFALWEKRLQRKETPYLYQEKNAAREEYYLSLHTLQALAKSLDAHTAFFTSEEAQEMRTALEKQFEGIGIVLQEGIEGVIIADLIQGGPAERSGQVFIGDLLVEVENKPVDKLTYEEVLEALKGQGKSEISLRLRKPREQETRLVHLIREKIAISDDRLKTEVHPYGNGNIGIITLSSFYEGGHLTSAEKDVREAIKKLKKEKPLKGVILDLRENSGGFLSQAVKIAGLFIARGVIVISKYSRGEMRFLRNLDGQVFFDGPLIVLTSKASASAAEIVAQALQDYGIALIVGDERTYGKGTIQYQTITDEAARAFYKVTVGRYYTASGRSTQIEGVKADLFVPTIFSSYNIGECYLEYPLPNDHVEAAFVDSLSDIDPRSRVWFQKNYLPNVHPPQQYWRKVLPILKENSNRRIAADKNFQLFLKIQESNKGRSPRAFRRDTNPLWGKEDLTLAEALNILKDMIVLQGKKE